MYRVTASWYRPTSSSMAAWLFGPGEWALLMVVQLVGISVSRSSPIALIRDDPDCQGPGRFMGAKYWEWDVDSSHPWFHVEPYQDIIPHRGDRSPETPGRHNRSPGSGMVMPGALHALSLSPDSGDQAKAASLLLDGLEISR